MELDKLKTTWKTIKTPVFSEETIYLNKLEKTHPVLKDIKKQFIIEIIGWSIFLACFYFIFDGHQKPIWLNTLLVSSVVFPIVHNAMSYQISKYVILGNNLQESLKNYIRKVKNYALLSILLRQIYLLCFLLFFSFGLNFNSERYIILAVIILFFLIQLLISIKTWSNRLSNLRNSLLSFDS